MKTIREWREARGWSQEELAARAGVTRMTVHYWETGQRVPIVTQWKQLADALGVKMDAIVIPERRPRRPVPPGPPDD